MSSSTPLAPASEKKRKSSSKRSSSKSTSNEKRSSRKYASDDQESVGEAVKPKTKRSSRKAKNLPIDELPEQEEVESKVEEVMGNGDEPAKEEVAKDLAENIENLAISTVPDDSDANSDSEESELSDADAMSTMNAIMEYNNALMQRLGELKKNSPGNVSKESVQSTIKDTYNDINAKYNKKQDNGGTHHSFELPIGDMMKSYGNFDTESLPDRPEEDHEDNSTVHENEEHQESAAADDSGENKISIGGGEGRDDIVVKVDATKTGITFSIHIPRN